MLNYTSTYPTGLSSLYWENLYLYLKYFNVRRVGGKTPNIRICFCAMELQIVLIPWHALTHLSVALFHPLPDADALSGNVDMLHPLYPDLW